jgi:hypothetical protein
MATKPSFIRIKELPQVRHKRMNRIHLSMVVYFGRQRSLFSGSAIPFFYGLSIYLPFTEYLKPIL